MHFEINFPFLFYANILYSLEEKNVVTKYTKTFHGLKKKGKESKTISAV